MNADSSVVEYATQQPYRSLRCNERCKVHFLNKSSQIVNINWLDYEGNEKLYLTLKPKHTFVIDSFITHPWVFRESKLKNLMIVDVFKMKKSDFVNRFLNQETYFVEERIVESTRIFFPFTHRFDEFLHVLIKNGVYSLQEICIQALLSNKPSLSMEWVPKSIIEDIIRYKKGQQLEHVYGKPVTT